MKTFFALLHMVALPPLLVNTGHAQSTSQSDQQLREDRERKPKIARTLKKRPHPSSARPLADSSNIQQASLIDDPATREREAGLDRARPLDTLSPRQVRPSEGGTSSGQKGDRDADNATSPVKVFGKIAARLYIFESDRSLTPDFQTTDANIGIESSKGPWGGKLEASLAEKSQSIGISNAYLSFTPLTGNEWRFGRVALAGVDSFAAELNHAPLGLGVADGLSAAQTIEPQSWMTFTLGGGIANALADDATLEFNTRASGQDRAAFGWTTLQISALKLQATYGYQPYQIRLRDDAQTKDLNEQREAVASIVEAAAGLDFTYLTLGGFFSLKEVGDERYAVPGQTLPTDPAPDPLLKSWSTQTTGAGITFKSPVDWSGHLGEKVGLTAGYSVADTRGGKPVSVERIMGATVFYKTDIVSTSLSYAYLEGDLGVSYKDPISQETFKTSDRVALGASYSF